MFAEWPASLSTGLRVEKQIPILGRPISDPAFLYLTVSPVCFCSITVLFCFLASVAFLLLMLHSLPCYGSRCAPCLRTPPILRASLIRRSRSTAIRLSLWSSGPFSFRRIDRIRRRERFRSRFSAFRVEPRRRRPPSCISLVDRVAPVSLPRAGLDGTCSIGSEPVPMSFFLISVERAVRTPCRAVIPVSAYRRTRLRRAST